MANIDPYKINLLQDPPTKGKEVELSIPAFLDADEKRRRAKSGLQRREREHQRKIERANRRRQAAWRGCVLFFLIFIAMCQAASLL